MDIREGEGMNEVVMTEKVTKPWGREYIVHPEARVKVLVINEGRTSLHYHPRKNEQMIVMSGKIAVETGGYYSENRVTHVLEENGTVFIEVGDVHRLTALEPSRILEIADGDDESIRIEDDYGRENK